MVGFEPSLFYIFRFDFRVIGRRFVTAAAFPFCPRRSLVFVWVANGVVDGAVRLVWRLLRPVWDLAHFLQVIPFGSSTIPFEQGPPCIRSLQITHGCPLLPKIVPPH